MLPFLSNYKVKSIPQKTFHPPQILENKFLTNKREPNKIHIELIQEATYKIALHKKEFHDLYLKTSNQTNPNKTQK